MQSTAKSPEMIAVLGLPMGLAQTQVLKPMLQQPSASRDDRLSHQSSSDMDISGGSMLGSEARDLHWEQVTAAVECDLGDPAGLDTAATIAATST
ncbi:hypothetical protein F4823DRAFT_564968 [Ustulina deusta]|nr:hypothetical protein F4823DRAFT_564968 [Ustulina deusta]